MDSSPALVLFVDLSLVFLELSLFSFLFLDLSLGKGSVVGVEAFVLLLGSVEAGLSGYGFEDALGSYGGCFAGLRSLGDFCVVQFWMFMDFGGGHESFSGEALAVDFRRESPWRWLSDGMVCG